MVNPEQLISSQNIHELCYYQGVILFCKPLLKQELGSATPVGCCQNQGVKRCQMATLVMTVSVSKIYVLRDILSLCLILDPHG